MMNHIRKIPKISLILLVPFLIGGCGGSTNVVDKSTPNYRLLNHNGSLEVVLEALEDGANPNVKAWGNKPVLVKSVDIFNYQYADIPQIVAALLKAGADPNVPSSGLFDGSSYSYSNDTYALVSAAEKRLYTIVILLLEAGANPNVHAHRGETPLHYVADPPVQYYVRGSALDALSALIEAGADPNREKVFSGYFDDGDDDIWQTNQQGPPLSFVKDTEIATVLIRAGADGGAALSLAAGRKSYDYDDGSDITQPDYGLDTVAALLKAGVDPDVRDDEDYTPLHRAAMAGKSEVIKALLEAGADPNARDVIDGNTPLHLVKKEDRTSVIALLQGGADPTILNARGDTFERTAGTLQQEAEAAERRAATEREIRQREQEQRNREAERELQRAQAEAAAAIEEAKRVEKRMLDRLESDMERLRREACRINGNC